MQGIRCAQSLLPPLNGAITASPENPVYGSVLTFSCDVGYFMIGSSSVRCGDSNGDGRGEWNGDPPTCRRKWLHHRLSLFPNIEKQWECFLKTKMPVFSWQRMIIFHNFSRTHTKATLQSNGMIPILWFYPTNALKLNLFEYKLTQQQTIKC